MGVALVEVKGVTRVTRCHRCAGMLIPDYLDLADAVCILCGDRYTGQERFARNATEEERTKLRGHETSEQRLRSAARRVRPVG